MNPFEIELPELTATSGLWIGDDRMRARPDQPGNDVRLYLWVDLRNHDFGSAPLDDAIFYGCLLDGVNLSRVTARRLHFAFCSVSDIGNPPLFARTTSVCGAANNFSLDERGLVSVDAARADAAASLLQSAQAHTGLFGYPELFEAGLRERSSPTDLVAVLAQLCFVPTWPLSENALYYLQSVLRASTQYTAQTEAPWQQPGSSGDCWRLLCLYLYCAEGVGSAEFRAFMDAQIADTGWSALWGRAVRIALARPWSGGQDGGTRRGARYWVPRLLERLLAASNSVTVDWAQWLAPSSAIPLDAWPILRRALGRVNAEFLLAGSDSVAEREAWQRAVDAALQDLLRTEEPVRVRVALDLCERLSPVALAVHRDLLNLPDSLDDETRGRAAWCAYQHWLGFAERLRVLASGRLTEPYLSRLAFSEDPGVDWVGYTSDSECEFLFDPRSLSSDLASGDCERARVAIERLHTFPFPELRSDVEALAGRPGPLQSAASAVAARYSRMAGG